MELLEDLKEYEQQVEDEKIEKLNEMHQQFIKHISALAEKMASFEPKKPPVKEEPLPKPPSVSSGSSPSKQSQAGDA